MSRNRNHIDVTVSVSGKPVAVTANVGWKIEQLMREALKQAGKPGEDPDGWELRTEQGVVLNPDGRVRDIPDGVTLFLDPKIGGGG